MTWQSLLDPDIQKFIRDHETDDVAALALKKPPQSDWDYKAVLDQIKSRQKAKLKLPRWTDHHPGILFPPADILEQASSAATARYKAALVKGKNFVDLTGGCGVDTCAMTEHFQRGICIEQEKTAADLIAHNIQLLSDTPVEVINGKAEEFTKNMPDTDVIIIDPQRRDHSRKGKYKFEDCSPNILELLPLLLQKSQSIIIKTSPMLDIAEGIKALGNVEAIHVLEWNGDCKELAFIVSNKTADTVPITAVSLDDDGEVLSSLTFTLQEEKTAQAELSPPLKYLYEPGPAFQKSGGFNVISKEFGVKKLAPHTHLYTSETLQTGFPGRVFEIIGQFPAKAEKIKLKQAHIKSRNFPLRSEELRKKLKIREGGNDYLFACTLLDDTKAILHTKKA